jgi:UPF0755 protein
MITKEKKFILAISLFFISVLFLMFIIVNSPRKEFPNKTFNFSVENGESVYSVSKRLHQKKMISSPFTFNILTILLSGNNGIHAGDYRFTNPEGLIKISYRMIKGYHNQPKVRVTIPEGTNSYEIAYILLKQLPDFNAPRFVSLAKRYEGYLYPDTYNFYANTKSEQIIEIMRDNFNNKIKKIEDKIDKSDKSFKDIIIMASIIEKETNDYNERRMVSGILWKRLDEKIKLQVDAPFYYITGRATNTTFKDLKIDSPYNTYIYYGLPKGPISNPSVDSIDAALSPVKSSYYFYLSGTDGIMRYANTYSKHLENKNKYIK